MAYTKKRHLLLRNNRALPLAGNSLSITPSLNIGEGFTNNIFGTIETREGDKPVTKVNNPHNLTAEEIHEIADYYIQQWMDLKENVRQHGVNSVKIFRKIL